MRFTGKIPIYSITVEYSEHYVIIVCDSITYLFKVKHKYKETVKIEQYIADDTREQNFLGQEGLLDGTLVSV